MLIMCVIFVTENGLSESGQSLMIQLLSSNPKCSICDWLGRIRPDTTILLSYRSFLLRIIPDIIVITDCMCAMFVFERGL